MVLVSCPNDDKEIFGQATELLRHHMGATVQVVQYEIANQQHDYVVLLAHLRNPPLAVVIKLAGPTTPMAATFERTAALHGLVAAQTTLPVPEVIAADTSCHVWPWRYFISTWVPGREWAVVQREMDAQEQADAYRQMGDAIGQIHSIAFPTFGEIHTDGQVQGETEYLAALRNRALRTIQNPAMREIFLSVLHAHIELFTDVDEPGLCHDDLHKHNILFDRQQGRWRLTAILDFDKAWAGDRESDLARLELWDGMMAAGFWASYQLRQTISPLDIQRRPIYQLLWCLEYARSTPRHRTDIRRLCELLGLPDIARF